jgi:hypothetical protein
MLRCRRSSSAAEAPRRRHGASLDWKLVGRAKGSAAASAGDEVAQERG